MFVMKDGTARDKLETSKQSLTKLEKNKNCPRGKKKNMKTHVNRKILQLNKKLFLHGKREIKNLGPFHLYNKK